jgi:hypothetical protein
MVLVVPTQLQVVGFAPVPMRFGQAGAWLQVLELAAHIMPVSEEHSSPFALAPPQTQEGEVVCGAEPSAGLQAGAVAAHRQERLL